MQSNACLDEKLVKQLPRTLISLSLVDASIETSSLPHLPRLITHLSLDQFTASYFNEGQESAAVTSASPTAPESSFVPSSSEYLLEFAFTGLPPGLVGLEVLVGPVYLPPKSFSHLVPSIRKLTIHDSLPLHGNFLLHLPPRLKELIIRVEELKDHHIKALPRSLQHILIKPTKIKLTKKAAADIPPHTSPYSPLTVHSDDVASKAWIAAQESGAKT